MSMLKRLFLYLCIYLPIVFVAGSISIVFALRKGEISCTPFMLVTSGLNYEQQWVKLEDVSEEMKNAIIVSEDASFFLHNGFDNTQLKEMKKHHEQYGSKIRGCSTISQQTAKNCFTFGSRTWLRKALEAYFTVLIEKIWGKERILEVYINVAQTGKDIYGVEVAAKRYFGIKASQLTMADASALVCCLPNPEHRTPEWVGLNLQDKRVIIAQRASLLKK
ncbi:MAG: monofunctional biosynthetic peptidoglycan transglycosylase [Bacteroidales bacterium]|nr:monofunctional biosynthetic peptidoglycan transglycosylase [Bacteroidales bacterium]